ncbi:hypothetical protein QVD17_37727 [Tagetes erecta]|uniref:Nucleic acid-binding, OB-fold protein n=1 Tax=Tagetes erecta TaxID=13708 RepID=A0AAD8NK32_TARER|nr:hypothetical protein QVD17_37727 [Tagetes erecta]
MEVGNLAMLIPKGDTPTLKVRLLRKWNPAGRRTETCFLFVDNEGTAIQGLPKGTEQMIVENRIRLGSCYQIQKYACRAADNYCNTLTHSTHLYFGSATRFTPIADTDEIPREYYDLASRERMESMCNKEETIGKPKLQSSAATHVYLEPRTADTQRLRDLYNNPALAEPSMSRSLQLSLPETLVSITDILNMTSAEVKGKTFTVYGEINNFTSNKWCYIACPLCTKGLSEVKNGWFCPKDDIVNDPIYSSDAMINIPCNTLIESNRQNNNTAIPQLLLDCIGKSTKFFMQVYKNERTNHTRATISKTVPVTDSIRTKMQVASLPAPPTPQQQQVILQQQPASTVKRQLQLTPEEGTSSKIEKITTEMTDGVILLELRNRASQHETSLRESSTCFSIFLLIRPYSCSGSSGIGSSKTYILDSAMRTIFSILYQFTNLIVKFILLKD